MASVQRRRFLYLCVGGSTLVFGCGADPAGEGDSDGETGESGDSEIGAETGAETQGCLDPLAAGSVLSALEFLGEGQAAVGEPQGEGLDGRLALDLGTLDAGSLTTANEDFFVRTAAPAQLDLESPWTVSLSGLVEAEVTLGMAELAALPQHTRVVLLECSGNGNNRAFGLISVAEWSGVLVADVIAEAGVLDAATAVSIVGFDEHAQPSPDAGCSWVYRLSELAEAGAMLVTHMNGVPLPLDHGQPVRLIAPGWFGCCNPKWVDGLRLVDDTEPASSQMIEFASRTHQSAAHALASDYAPGLMQQAAMPVRVEKWALEGELVYEIVGIMWGGSVLTDSLQIHFNGGPGAAVEVCPAQETTDVWTLWRYTWRPEAIGEYAIVMSVDPSIPAVRLDSGYYQRRVMVDEV